jgi:hypothetical protein
MRLRRVMQILLTEKGRKRLAFFEDKLVGRAKALLLVEQQAINEAVLHCLLVNGIGPRNEVGVLRALQTSFDFASVPQIVKLLQDQSNHACEEKHQGKLNSTTNLDYVHYQQFPGLVVLLFSRHLCTHNDSVGLVSKPYQLRIPYGVIEQLLHKAALALIEHGRFREEGFGDIRLCAKPVGVVTSPVL